MVKMAVGKHVRQDKQASSSLCFRGTVVIFVGVCVLAVWMMISSSPIPAERQSFSGIRKITPEIKPTDSSSGSQATYDSTFPAVESHGEVLELSIQLALSSLEIVYTHFYQFVDRRLSYHCDLLTRGMGGLEMESRKAEEWASQLQCWSLQLINCFAFKSEFLSIICKPDFLVKLPSM